MKTFKNPSNCRLWNTQPLKSADLAIDRFVVVESYVDGEHFSRALRRCRECGQLYFYEFYETTDPDGNDPQYSTYVPIETKEQVEALKKTDHQGLLDFYPRLQKDFPADAAEPQIRWVRA